MKMVNELPENLRDLEDRLRSRVFEPDLGLRARVMRAVESEIVATEPAQRPAASAGWGWAAIAAAIVLVANLSMISASQNEFSLEPAPSANQASAELRAIQRLENQEGRFQ